MTLYDTVKQAILKEYQDGLRQTGLAKKHHVSQQTISRLLSAKNNCSGLTLDVVQKMFPLAVLSLDGGKKFEISSGPSEEELVRREAYEQFRKDAITEVAKLDLPADTLKTVLQTLLLVRFDDRFVYL
jgi:transcriptional regulator with XRE-family HTH domain